MHSQGFAASGVKDITDTAGVPKGSFYAYFPSKESLAAAILEHYWSDIEMRLLPILDAEGPAQERIKRFFHALADEHEASDFLLGCLVGKLSLELGGSSEPVRSRGWPARHSSRAARVSSARTWPSGSWITAGMSGLSMTFPPDRWRTSSTFAIATAFTWSSTASCSRPW